MHNPGTVSGNSQNGLTHEQEIQAAYTEDFMNLDDNIFSLDAESRELIFGMSLGICIRINVNCDYRSIRYG